MTLPITGVMKIEMYAPVADMMSMETKKTFPDCRCSRELLRNVMAAAPETSPSIPMEMCAQRKSRWAPVIGGVIWGSHRSGYSPDGWCGKRVSGAVARAGPGVHTTSMFTAGATPLTAAIVSRVTSHAW